MAENEETNGIPEAPEEGAAPPTAQEGQAKPVVTDAAAIVRKMASQLMETDVEANKDVREFLDENGKLMCTAEITFEPAPLGFPEEYDRMTSLVLTNPTTGESINLLDLFDKVPFEEGGDRKPVTVLISNGNKGLEKKKRFLEYRHQGRVVFLDEIADPSDVAVFLHELGHAEQYHDDDYQAIPPLILSIMRKMWLDDAPSRDKLSEIFAAVPELEKIKSDPGFQEFLEWQDREERLKAQWEEVNDKAYGLKGRKLKENKAAQETVWNLMLDAGEKAQALGKEQRLRNISLLPSRLMELNANDRAFEKMREIKERIGIDLSQPHIKNEDGKESISDPGLLLREGVQSDPHYATPKNMTFPSADGPFTILES